MNKADSETPHLSYTSVAPKAWLNSRGAARAFLDGEALAVVLRRLEFLLRSRLVFLCVFAAGLLLSIALVLIIPKTYSGTARVLVVSANVARDPTVASIDLPSIATSTAVLSSVIDRLRIPGNLRDLKRRVRASVKSKSSIIEINYRDKNASRAIEVPNAIADELVTYYDSISSNGSDVTVRKLDQSIGAVQQRLRMLDDASSFQARMHPFVQSDKSLEDATLRLDDLTTQERLASAALAGDVAQRVAVMGDPKIQSKTVRFEKLQNDPTYLQLESGIAKDEANLAFSKASYTDQFPGLDGLKDKLRIERELSAQHTRSALSSSVSFSSSEAATSANIRKSDAVVIADRARLDAIDGLLSSARHRLDDALDGGTTAQRLRLEQDAARADYLSLRARRAGAIASRAEALATGSLVVVDRAVSTNSAIVGLGPIGLGVIMWLLSVLVAVFVAYVVDLSDSRIDRAEQVEELYGVPLLGLIDVSL